MLAAVVEKPSLEIESATPTSVRVVVAQIPACGSSRSIGDFFHLCHHLLLICRDPSRDRSTPEVALCLAPPIYICTSSQWIHRDLDYRYMSMKDHVAAYREGFVGRLGVEQQPKEIWFGVWGKVLIVLVVGHWSFKPAR